MSLRVGAWTTYLAMMGVWWIWPLERAHAACTRTLSAGANVASAVSSAAPGSTICLEGGSFGDVQLNNMTKSPRITLRSVTSQSASIYLRFSGANGITVDSVTLTGAEFAGASTKNVTIQNSAFTGSAVFNDLADSNVLLTNNTHNNIQAGGQYSSPARLHLSYSSATHSGVTIQNSTMDGGSADGVQTGVGVNIIGNVFKNIREGACSDCHTDAIQLLGATGTVIQGNYLYSVASGIVAYDGVARVTIENNVIDTGGRPWGIELYSDDGSIVRHNTLLYRANCDYNLACGTISLDHKSSDPAGRGTVIVDNIATSIDVSSGSTYAQLSNNLIRVGAPSGNISGTPTYVGGSTPTTFAEFELAAGSLGKGVGTEPAGSDLGVMISSPLPGPRPLPAPSNLRIAP
ncbi:MAG: right-handed parallel beta-helix repeat-containing protein [Deltaproteobacteria bacterium]|nr:right-handed parallel beta-helix repeat-containing protein [Deltaproteobacteria bacterium]